MLLNHHVILYPFWKTLHILVVLFGPWAKQVPRCNSWQDTSQLMHKSLCPAQTSAEQLIRLNVMKGSSYGCTKIYCAAQHV